LKKIKIVKSAKKLFHRSVAIGENLWLNKSILTTKGTKSAKLYINRKTFFTMKDMKNLKKTKWDTDQHRFPQIKAVI